MAEEQGWRKVHPTCKPCAISTAEVIDMYEAIWDNIDEIIHPPLVKEKKEVTPKERLGWMVPEFEFLVRENSWHCNLNPDKILPAFEKVKSTMAREQWKAFSDAVDEVYGQFIEEAGNLGDYRTECDRVEKIIEKQMGKLEGQTWEQVYKMKGSK